jgi:hypothetical protein
MRRTVAIAALILLLSGLVAFGQSTNSLTEIESFEYAPYNAIGELYFVIQTNVVGTTMNWTNNHAEMWYPALITTTLPGNGSTNVFTAFVISEISTRQYRETVVQTNELGATITNQLHQLTNASFAYYTNRVGIMTNENGFSEAITDTQTKNHYLLRGDVLRLTWSMTTNKFVKIFGRR